VAARFRIFENHVNATLEIFNNTTEDAKKIWIGSNSGQRSHGSSRGSRGFKRIHDVSGRPLKHSSILLLPFELTGWANNRNGTIIRAIDVNVRIVRIEQYAVRYVSGMNQGNNSV